MLHNHSGLFGCLLVVTLVAILATYSSAQIVCDSVLKDGTFRTLARRERSYSSLVYAARLTKMSYSEAKKDFEANGGIVIDGIPFSAGMSESEYNRSIDKLKTSLDIKNIQEHEAELIVADGDPTIVRAWGIAYKGGKGWWLGCGLSMT